MEKYNELHNFAPDATLQQQTQRSIRSRRIRRITSSIILVTFCLYLWSLPEADEPYGRFNQHQSLNEPEFDWFKIKPSEEVEWTACFENQKCARLNLPLDYETPEGPKTAIALRMIPANDTENYKGTILVNPGGPGGSGADFVAKYGNSLAKIIGPQFDILGFDPRGVGASTPAAKCFASLSEQKIWELQAGPFITNSSSKDTIALARSRERLHSELCWVAIGGNGEYDVNGTAEEWGIGRFMSTASVATDMLRITEKLGQKKLKYWGFSYGSVLGQYFTAMYPDKVGRVIIDGVFDATNYRASLWSTNLVDTDAIYDSIFELCHAAGPSKCPIYEPTVKETKDRALRIAQSLVDSPIALPFTTKGPIIMTSSMLYKYTFAALYTPLKVFKILTEALLAIETRNDTALVDIIESNVDAGFRCNCTQQRLPSVSDSSDPFHAIACGDGEKLSDKPGEYEAWVANLTATSAFGAPALSAMYLRCAEWKITPKWRYTGPLSTNESFSDSPILIISPKYDPVCPLSDAKRVQGRYAGSRLLVQNSRGHCSISAPSLCTGKVIRAYFQDGELPEEGTVCQPDELPFIGKVDRAEILSTGDTEMLKALQDLSEVIHGLVKI